MNAQFTFVGSARILSNTSTATPSSTVPQHQPQQQFKTINIMPKATDDSIELPKSYEQWSYDRARSECSRRHLSTTGLKYELIRNIVNNDIEQRGLQPVIVYDNDNDPDGSLEMRKVHRLKARKKKTEERLRALSDRAANLIVTKCPHKTQPNEGSSEGIDESGDVSEGEAGLEGETAET
ncbi:uncharacterized protein LY89DRAFT_662991 [Mollisia scopiformis]|uniref:SAP domain-containing protein n=1 Tax=Mollisia scopiformis TaxID=149040 RepID=A0A194XVI3_MOLSC|nr:uncharacterized protein LY89DRAFT_662991 [Mollisia scopiformis]KUJ24238.1 hypothetical protein LY89DRAFT_662991 [Mollisia scopiformis]